MRQSKTAAQSMSISIPALRMEAFRIAGRENDYDDKMVKSIEVFLPNRTQLMDAFIALAQYRDTEETRQKDVVAGPACVLMRDGGMDERGRDGSRDSQRGCRRAQGR
jgi:hypothetical protein